jgi:hypothetical protein
MERAASTEHDLVVVPSVANANVYFVRLWLAGKAYVCRTQVLHHLTEVTDKRLRTAALAAAPDGDEDPEWVPNGSDAAPQVRAFLPAGAHCS